MFLERGGATTEGLADEATRVQVLKFCFIESVLSFEYIYMYMSYLSYMSII